MNKIKCFLALTTVSIAAPALAATPQSYAKLDKASEAACIKAADLTGAGVGPVSRYSDRVMIDARVVTGQWPQAHMKGARARLLCLYNRKTKRTEVQEISDPVIATTMPVLDVKDVQWQAEVIGGNGIVDRSEVTLFLGSDGKIGGKSGCNGYSVNYQLTGDVLKVYPPTIGTRMMCSPALMAQESSFQSLLEQAQSVSLTPEGALLITSAGGVVSRFTRN